MATLSDGERAARARIITYHTVQRSRTMERPRAVHATPLSSLSDLWLCRRLFGIASLLRTRNLHAWRASSGGLYIVYSLPSGPAQGPPARSIKAGTARREYDLF